MYGRFYCDWIEAEMTVYGSACCALLRFLKREMHRILPVVPVNRMFRSIQGVYIKVKR